MFVASACKSAWARGCLGGCCGSSLLSIAPNGATGVGLEGWRSCCARPRQATPRRAKPAAQRRRLMPRNSGQLKRSVNAVTTATRALSAQQQLTLALRLLLLCPKMFVTVFGRGGVAKPAPAFIWPVFAQQAMPFALSMLIATAGNGLWARGPWDMGSCLLRLRQATRSAQIVITDGQASSHEDELKTSSWLGHRCAATTPQAFGRADY